MSQYRPIVIATTITVLLAYGMHLYAADQSTITSDDLDRVYSAIKQNNWRLVEKEVTPLIQRQSPAQRYIIGRLRYIYIFSLAIQTESGHLKYADLKKKLAIVEKRLVIQPWHPVSQNANPCFNQICADKDNPSLLVTTQANSNSTQIYSFENFDMGAPINIASFKGQNARLGGILDKIEINENLPKAERSNSHVTWFFRLYAKDSFIDYER